MHQHDDNLTLRNMLSFSTNTARPQKLKNAETCLETCLKTHLKDISKLLTCLVSNVPVLLTTVNSSNSLLGLLFSHRVKFFSK